MKPITFYYVVCHWSKFNKVADRLGISGVRVLIGRSDSEMAHCLEKQLNFYLFMQGA